MCKGISEIRGYVGPEVGKASCPSAMHADKVGNGEKRPWQAGMSKLMNVLAGYVGRDGRDN